MDFEDLKEQRKSRHILAEQNRIEEMESDGEEDLSLAAIDLHL